MRKQKSVREEDRKKQIEFNKNRSPEANYVGRELDKLFVVLYKVQTFLVFVRFEEMQYKIIGLTTPFLG